MDTAISSRRFEGLLHSALLMLSMGLLTGVIGYALAGSVGMVWSVLLGVAALYFGPRVSPRTLLRLNGARELNTWELPGLHRLVSSLAERAGLRYAPALFYIHSATPNALTVGARHNACIAVTDGLLRHLDERELRGVLAHEVSHVRNNDMKLLGLAESFRRLTSAMSHIGIFLLLLSFPLLLLRGSAFPWLGVLLLTAAPALSVMLQLALSRTREFSADLEAASITGDPEGLALALHTLESIQGGFWLRLFGLRPLSPVPDVLRTHPSTQERVQRLLLLRDAHGSRARLPSHHARPEPPTFLVRPTNGWHGRGVWLRP